jgi:WD40 repeat protein
MLIGTAALALAQPKAGARPRDGADDRDSQPVLTLEGHRDGIFSIAFSPDGRRLATASQDRLIKVWSLDQIVARGEKEARASAGGGQ